MGTVITLTQAQLVTFKAAIVANPTWSAFPNTQDGALDLAGSSNQILWTGCFNFRFFGTVG